MFVLEVSKEEMQLLYTGLETLRGEAKAKGFPHLDFEAKMLQQRLSSTYDPNGSMF